MNGTNRVIRASILRGMDVKNRDWEDLGEIQDFMVDVQNGCVAYAVLSFGGVFGIGDKLFAVPWNAMDVDTEENVFVLDAAKSDLKNAPGFDKDNWPDMADERWSSSIHKYYKARPYWETAQKR
jgi:sporulation protein YlmC with PRC-barrel domain